MAVHINTLNGGDITITTGGSTPSEPTAPNGKVLYKTSANGEWLQSDANITDGTFNGFTEKNSAVAVIIPSKDASENDITGINSSAFSNCRGLTNVTIGNGVMSIGSQAFKNCTNLTNVTLSDSMDSIGYQAFYGCSGLTSVTIPDSVGSIGASAFRGCIGLTSVTIPDSVMSIGDGAFYGCSRLANVTITENGENAETVKQLMIDAGVDENITWNMPS